MVAGLEEQRGIPFQSQLDPCPARQPEAHHRGRHRMLKEVVRAATGDQVEPGPSLSGGNDVDQLVHREPGDADRARRRCGRGARTTPKGWARQRGEERDRQSGRREVADQGVEPHAEPWGDPVPRGHLCRQSGAQTLKRQRRPPRDVRPPSKRDDPLRTSDRREQEQSEAGDGDQREPTETNHGGTSDAGPSLQYPVRPIVTTGSTLADRYVRVENWSMRTVVAFVVLVVSATLASAQAADTMVTAQGFLQRDDQVDVWTIVVPLPLQALGARTYVVPVVGKPERWNKFVNHYIEATGRVTRSPERGNPPITMEIENAKEVEPPGTGHASVDRGMTLHADVTLSVIPNRFSWRDANGNDTGVNPFVLFTILHRRSTPIFYVLS